MRFGVMNAAGIFILKFNDQCQRPVETNQFVKCQHFRILSLLFDRCSVWWTVWWLLSPVWPTKTVDDCLIAILLVMDSDGFCQIRWNYVCHSIFGRILLFHRFHGDSGECFRGDCDWITNLTFHSPFPLHLTHQVYISEISSPDIRGFLSAIQKIAGHLGVLISFSLGAYLDWRQLAMLVSVAPMLLFLTVIYIPETPSFLVLKGRDEEAYR